MGVRTLRVVRLAAGPDRRAGRDAGASAETTRSSTTRLSAASASQRVRRDARTSVETARPITGRPPTPVAGHEPGRSITPSYGSRPPAPRSSPATRGSTLGQATAVRARHAPYRAVNDLGDIYRRLPSEGTLEQLAARYRSAQRDGAQLADRPGPALTLPIPALARAIPAAATASTAIHTLHALPDLEGALPEQLLEIARRNAVDALHRCHRALELDGADHGYTAEEWLPVLYDIARSLLQSARSDSEPPSLVQATQDAIGWLSRSIAELDEGSEEAPSSLAETLARLLAVWIFTDFALRHQPSA